jgi:hypothetical protein
LNDITADMLKLQSTLGLSLRILRKPKPCHVFPQALIEVAERADNSQVGKDGGAATNRRQVLDIWCDDGCGVKESDLHFAHI